MQELLGKPRVAAATYRSALQMIPPGAEPPPAMRPVLDHANKAVATNSRELETFLEDRMKDLRVRHADAPLGRFERCLATLLQKQPIYRQRPSFMHFPQLPAIEFYGRREFPWLDSIEAASDPFSIPPPEISLGCSCGSRAGARKGGVAVEASVGRLFICPGNALGPLAAAWPLVSADDRRNTSGMEGGPSRIAVAASSKGGAS